MVLFVFWNILFKVCNNACIMPRFGKKYFHPFLLSVLKMNYTVNFDDNFFAFLVVLKPEFSIRSL